MMRKISKKENLGITLIALVITIIILLILAGITISQLAGSGLFNNTQTAKQEYENAQAKEDDILKQYENAISTGEILSDRDTITVSDEDYSNLVTDVNTLKTKNTIQPSTFSIISNRINGNKFYLNKLGSIVQIEINGDTGSKNIAANQVVQLASGLPKCACSIQELTITMDNPGLYARAWIDSTGNLYIYHSGENYTGNIFIGGLYLTSE